MIIKKFQAKNEAEALALAKKELGSEVTMIHSRNVKPKGFFSFLKKMQKALKKHTLRHTACLSSPLLKVRMILPLNPTAQAFF